MYVNNHSPFFSPTFLPSCQEKGGKGYLVELFLSEKAIESFFFNCFEYKENKHTFFHLFFILKWTIMLSTSSDGFTLASDWLCDRRLGFASMQPVHLILHNLPLPSPSMHNLPLPSPSIHNLPLPSPSIHNLPLPSPSIHNLPLPLGSQCPFLFLAIRSEYREVGCEKIQACKIEVQGRDFTLKLPYFGVDPFSM